MTCLISAGTEVYRPAGYRVPLAGELYVSKDGKVKVAAGGAVHSGQRLIVRVLNTREDFNGAAAVYS